MAKAEVLATMGTATIPTEVGIINNPYRAETFRSKAGSTIEILFYYTDLKRSDGAITDDELTPIVLENDRLIGWGWSFLTQDTSRHEITIRER